jgi:hypothetical protein
MAAAAAFKPIGDRTPYDNLQVQVQGVKDSTPFPFFEKADGSRYCALPHKTEYKIRLANMKNLRASVAIEIDNKSIGVFRLDPYQSWAIERSAAEAKVLTFVAETSKEAKEGEIAAGAQENGLVKITYRAEKKKKQEEVRLDMQPQIQYSAPVDSAYFSFGAPVAYSNGFGGPAAPSGGGFGFGSSGNAPYIEPASAGFGFGRVTYQQQCAQPPGFGGASAQSFQSGATVAGRASEQRFVDAEPIDEYDEDEKRVILFRLVVAAEPEVKYSPLKAVPEPPMPMRVD